MRYDLIVVLAVAGLLPAALIVTKLVQWWDRLARIESGIERREEGSERTRLRLSILSVRSNVAALALISLAAFLLVSLEVYRTMWPDKSSASVALEELLRSKLPDPEVQAQRHREIVDTIRNARAADPSNPTDEQWRRKLADLEVKVTQLKRQLDGGKTPAGIISISPRTPSSLPVASIVTALALLVGAFLIGGLFYILMKKHLVSKKAGTAAAATSLAVGSLLGGMTLFKDFTLFQHLDIRFGRGESRLVTPQPLIPQPAALPPPAPQPVALAAPPPPTDVHVDLSLRLLEPSSATVECAHHVGPFRDGTAILSGEEINHLNGVIDDIAKKAERVIAVMLIGSADKRALTSKTAKSFDSNPALAQARSDYVQGKLEPVLGTKDFIKSFRAPTKTDEKASPDDLKEDRMVDICLVLK